MTDNQRRNRSTDEIEREVESARTELARSIEKLEAEFSPDALVERGMSYFRGDGRRHIATLGSKAEANPLAVLLIGIGFAWLAFGPSRAPERESRDRLDDFDRPEPHEGRSPYPAPPPARPAADLSTTPPADRPATGASAGAELTRPDMSGNLSATSGAAGGSDPLRSPERSRTDGPLTPDAPRPTAPGSVAGVGSAAGSGVGASPVGNVAVSADRDGADGGKTR